MTWHERLAAAERAMRLAEVYPVAYTRDRGWHFIETLADPFAEIPMADDDPIELFERTPVEVPVDLRRGVGWRNMAPCGTPGAHQRHKRNGEEPDPACVAAYRKWDRERKQLRRGRQPILRAVS